MDLLYSFSLKKGLLILSLLLCLFGFTTKQSHAAISSASATLTTSRPSASTPLSANAIVGSSTFSIFNNGSRYLASDSAQILRGVGTQSNTGLNIASQSADLLTVFITNSTIAFAGSGSDLLIVPITAMHAIKFSPSQAIPIGGHIVITYPGASNNSASPSASTFAFNGLNQTASTNIKAAFSSGGTTCTFVAASPTITCTTGVAVINAGTIVTIYIGCSALSGTSCSTQVPRLINPTKTATAGNADIWKVGIATTDVSSNTLESTTVAIGTVESVTVRASIDPSLTFIISGIADGGQVNTGNLTQCGETELTNSGTTSTATDVGLGSLQIAPAPGVKLNNIAAQLLTVQTNGANGYSITATSSGSLTNASTGFSVNSSLTPLVFPASGHFFGLHPCGIDTDVTRWIQGAVTTACSTYVPGASPVCKYAWPNNSPMLIASRPTGPVGDTVVTGSGLTSVAYAATQDVTLPPGIYQTVITYVATPSF